METAAPADGIPADSHPPVRGVRGWMVAQGLTLAAGRAAGSVALLVVTPWLVTHLGAADYGIWVSVSALAAVAALIDVGATAGPSRLVSRYIAIDEPALVVGLVSTGLAVQLAQCVVIGGLAWLAAPLVAGP